MSRQGGFQAIKLVIFITGLALIGLGFFGYAIWANMNHTWTADSKITGTQDLDDALKLLDDTKVDNAELDKMNTQLNF